MAVAFQELAAMVSSVYGFGALGPATRVVTISGGIMKAITLLTACLMIGSGALAQQYNTSGATLTLNAAQGPPYPITGVNLALGTTAILAISGNANSPIVLAASSALASTGLPTAGGLLDLSPSGLQVIGNGLEAGQSLWTTGQAGAFLLGGVIPSNLPTGVSVSFQAGVVDPTVLAFTLTAATASTITQGITMLSLGPFTPAGPACHNVSLVPYGFTLPFYSQNYTSFFVSENGFVSFGSCTTDFTATPNEFLAQMPRLAGFWCNLEPASTDCVTVTIDPTSVFNKVRVDFNNCPEWTSSAVHTFGIEIEDGTGDIRIQHSYSNLSAFLEQIVGITPGGNVSTAPQKDLSTMGTIGPIVGAPNEAFWEWFGLTTMPFYTPPVSNPFDLAGLEVRFLGTNLGTSGALYTGLN